MATPSPDLPKLIEVFSSQALTPLGEQKTRYFFSNSVNERRAMRWRWRA